MGPGNSEGLQVGTRLHACSTQATSTTHHERKGHSPHADRDREDGHQRSNSSSGPLRQTISEPTVSLGLLCLLVFCALDIINFYTANTKVFVKIRNETDDI